MQDKVVILTGCSSGIGLATAEILLTAGARVFGVDISPCPENLTSSSTLKFMQCDLTKSSAPDEVAKACKEAFGGRIDALLNVAGIMDYLNSADTITDEIWDRVIAVNLTVPVKLMRAVLPTMKEQKKGNIVNVASRASFSGASAGLAYTASKHGLVGATKNTAWRFRNEGIRCNAVCPGAVATQIFQNLGPDAGDKLDMAAFAEVRPVHALGKSDSPMSAKTIADVIVYLASDNSAGMNGSLIPVDDGWSCI